LEPTVHCDIIEHPKRKNQSIFVVEINDYIHAVPFILDKEDRIILKQHSRAGSSIKSIRAINEKY
jgi:hypothetical protein